MDRRALEDAFHQRMIQVYEEAAEAGYRATRFLQLVEAEGGLLAAKRLLAQRQHPEGLTRLWEMGRLDASMEAAIAYEDRWHPLFSEAEIEVARQRLRDLRYTPPERAS